MSLCVGFVAIVVLGDVGPVAQGVFAEDKARAAVEEMGGHVEENLRGCVC